MCGQRKRYLTGTERLRQKEQSVKERKQAGIIGRDRMIKGRGNREQTDGILHLCDSFCT